MSATDVFLYHQRVYRMFVGGKVNTVTAGNQAIVAYNSQVKRIKDSANYGVSDIKALILFSFLHDPLKLGDVAGYGKIDLVNRSLGGFIEWRKNHRRDIHEAGLTKAIMKLRPVESKLGKELEDQIEEAFTL